MREDSQSFLHDNLSLCQNRAYLEQFPLKLVLLKTLQFSGECTKMLRVTYNFCLESDSGIGGGGDRVESPTHTYNLIYECLNVELGVGRVESPAPLDTDLIHECPNVELVYSL